MSAVKELIRTEADGSLSFGDYTLGAKEKLDGFAHDGASFKVKTFNEITKLEKDGAFAYESVPGTAVLGYVNDGNKISFTVEAPEDAEVTVGVAEETEYDVTIAGASVGTMKSNLGGKLTISVETASGAVEVVLIKK